MELNTNIDFTQVIEAINNKTGEKQFLLYDNNEWITITESEYEDIKGGH